MSWARRLGSGLAFVGTTWLGLAACDRRDEAPSGAAAGAAQRASASASAATTASVAPTASEPAREPPRALPREVKRSSLRPSARAEQAPRLVIVAGGDVNLGRELGERILKDPASVAPFAALAPYFIGADLRFVNLESQLSDQGGETQSKLNRLIFTGPPGGADVLAKSGIDIVSLANNHQWDYGKRAFRETIANLERAQVAYVGASTTPNAMYRPTVLRRAGWSIAWFAVTDIWNQGPLSEHEARDYVAGARFDRLSGELSRARREHDVVLVSYHGGAEYIDMPLRWSQEFAGFVLRAGADALIGHHPHVPQGVGWVDGRPALYSLGNLVFRMNSQYPWTGIGYLARLTFDVDGSFGVEACPYNIIGDTPTPFAPGAEAQKRAFESRLTRTSSYVGRTSLGPEAGDGCRFLLPPALSDRAPPALSAAPTGPGAAR
jgi:poly-gamma-glutamate synthesis protein (capsule biosynthesis protein)